MKLLLDNIDKDKCDVYYYSLGKSPNWYDGKDKPSQFEFIINQIIKLKLFPFFLKKNGIEIVHLNSGLTQLSIFREGILSLLAKLVGCKSLFFIHGWTKLFFKIRVSDHNRCIRVFDYVLQLRLWMENT